MGAADLIERYLSPLPEASYNFVQRWDYALLAQAMCNKGGKYKVFKVGYRQRCCVLDVLSAQQQLKGQAPHAGLG